MLKIKIKLIVYGMIEILSFASCSIVAKHLFEEALIGDYMLLLVCGFSFFESVVHAGECTYKIAKEKAKIKDKENADK